MIDYRVIGYLTTSENRFDCDSENIIEVFADKNSAWLLWYHLKDKYKHIFIYNFGGEKQDPSKGIDGLNSWVKHP